jgi:hypothetical protein
MRFLGLLVAGLLLVGCASDTTTGDEQAQVSPPATTAPAEPDTQTGPEAVPEPNPDSTNAAEPCENVMFQRAQGTIRAQQSALAKSDFEAARAYASDNFRSGVSIDQFQGIIEGNYSFLLGDPAVTFVDCQRRGNSALIRAEVAGSPVTVMLYGVVLENESWFIDAASVAGTRDAVTT